MGLAYLGLAPVPRGRLNNSYEWIDFKNLRWPWGCCVGACPNLSIAIATPNHCMAPPVGLS